MKPLPPVRLMNSKLPPAAKELASSSGACRKEKENSVREPRITAVEAVNCVTKKLELREQISPQSSQTRREERALRKRKAQPGRRATLPSAVPETAVAIEFLPLCGR